MRIISIVNQKGGCGKTTTAINLAACLAMKERRVLLLDLDPQGHSCLGLGHRPEGASPSLYDVFCGEADLNEVLVPQVQPGLTIAPSNLLLSAAEQSLAGANDRERRLLNQFRILRTPFDYILIDCPPSLGLLTINALRASDEAFVPVETSLFSLHGLAKLNETIQMIQANCSHLIDARIILTMFDPRTRISQEIRREITEQFPSSIFKTVIRNTVRLREAASRGIPVTSYAPGSIGSEDYNALAQEVLADEEQILTSTPLTHTSEVKTSLVNEKGEVLITIQMPGAKDVRVAGDFNEWIPDRKVFSIRDENGLWKKVLRLSPGNYEYRIVVDGQWQEHPENPNIVENGCGGYNSLLTVE
jgi:chromosome partitioning protein